MRYLALLLAILFSSHSASALPRYSKFLERQIEKANWTLQASDDGAAQVCTERGDWFQFRNFYLGIRPNVTFTIGLSSVAIVPEITIFWERTIPNEWEPYSP